MVQLVSPLLYRLSWKLYRLPAPTLHYELFLNESILFKKISSESLASDNNGRFFMTLGPEDVQYITEGLSHPCSMSLRVSDGVHVSPCTSSVPLPSELILLIKEHQENTSSSTSEVGVTYNEVGVASSITSNSESSLPEIIHGNKVSQYMNM